MSLKSYVPIIVFSKQKKGFFIRRKERKVERGRKGSRGEGKKRVEKRRRGDRIDRKRGMKKVKIRKEKRGDILKKKIK